MIYKWEIKMSYTAGEISPQVSQQDSQSNLIIIKAQAPISQGSLLSFYRTGRAAQSRSSLRKKTV